MVLKLSTEEAQVSIPTDLQAVPSMKHRLSPARAFWLFISQASKLDEKQRKLVEQIRVAHPDLDRAYQLAQTFFCMLAERSGIRELGALLMAFGAIMLAVRVHRHMGDSNIAVL